MDMQKKEPLLVAGLCSTVLLISGCTVSESSTEGPVTAASPTVASSPLAGGCRVTRPTKEGIPEGVREVVDGPVFGQGKLWVHAWWAEKPILTSVREENEIKYPSFTLRNGEVTDQLGPPRLQIKRLDGAGEASGDTGGYATAQDDSGRILNWWPTGIDFSSSGCWQVTETVGGTSIIYTIRL